MSLSPPRLTDHLGYWLRLVSNQVSHGFARRLAEHDVTTAEWVVLRELYDVEAQPPSRLAERLGLTRGAVSKLADRLLAKELVARAAHESDGRAHTLALTKAGRALVPALAALADANDAQFFGHLAPEQRRALEEALREIVTRQGLSAHPID